MRRCPCPILVVTATVAGHYSMVCEALGCGAYDAVCTPVLGSDPPAKAGAQLLEKLSAVDRIRRNLPARANVTPAAIENRPRVIHARSSAVPLVALGASTGGPQALRAILSQWPADFPAAVLVVQHIGEEFSDSLVRWLADHSKLKVRAAATGDRPQAGTVLVAATNDHLIMTRAQVLDYSAEPRGIPFRPSVDVLFESLVGNWPPPSAGVLLTGIGRDGAEGLLKLRQAGWHTIAQDEATSVVYGMPQAARDRGAAEKILAIDGVASHVAAWLRTAARSR